MTLSRYLGRLVDSRTDWFAGLDERLPVPLLRHAAESCLSGLAPTVAATMEIACRRTAAATTTSTVTGYRARGARRGAVVEPCALPFDIGQRFLGELYDLVSGSSRRFESVREQLRDGLTKDPGDARRVAVLLSDALAGALGLPAPVAHAAVAVALTAIGISGWDAWYRPSPSAFALPHQIDRRQRDASVMDRVDDGGSFRVLATGVSV